MREFIKELNSCLEELQKFNHDAWTKSDSIHVKMGFANAAHAYKIAIENVNRIAEKYNGYSLCKTREFCDYQFLKDDGWILCSQTMPEPYKHVLVWCKGRIIGGTCEGEEHQCYGIGVIYCGKWSVVHCEDMKAIEVIAWQQLPDPYIEKSDGSSPNVADGSSRIE